MITIVSGNILESEAECLVNTVNCEGYMGKGIAYQFKKAYPLNNEDYIKACRSGILSVGKIHSYKEKNKTIINFPTKDKWREKSQVWYIEKGMDKLVDYIIKNNIKSIAIPPLGCGNGGLKWDDVQRILISKVEFLNNDVNVMIYAPTMKNMSSTISNAPKLNLSHLILMKYKLSLKNFGKIRLQKTAFFMNLFMNKDYFIFKPQTYGPYAHSIQVLSKDIQEYQEYYNKTTEDSYEYAVNVLISNKIKSELNKLDRMINKAITLVNSYPNTFLLELASTICYIIKNNEVSNEKEIVELVRNWSDRKKNIYDEDIIYKSINELESRNLIIRDLLKYRLNFS